MRHLYVDVETIPTQRQDVRDRLHEQALADAREAEPPANYKKPEAIDRWRAERIAAAPDAAEESVRKTALDGGYGELVAVCWAWDDEEVSSLQRGEGGEFVLLDGLWRALRQRVVSGGHAIRWVGHNVTFDLQFLHHRSVIHGIRPTVPLPRLDAVWKGTYYDTMYEWAGLRGSVKLTTLCDMLGIDIADDDIDGSQVWAAYQDGRIDDIVEHCRRDVERVREIHRRLRFGT